jgi:trehalose utilization protein
MGVENMRVTVWNEYMHEREKAEIAAIYPKGIHSAIADSLRQKTNAQIKTATMCDEGQGLTDEVLDNTDVLVYWAHKAHREITEENAQRIRRRVLEGMGLIALHSAHASKMFRLLLGTEAGKLRWREEGELERLWVVSPGHPIAEGIGEYFEIEQEETYGEYFDIPEPDELVFISWFSGGEVFRSGCCFKRGAGRMFYFRPGHETYPIYHDENVQKVIANAVCWAAPKGGSHVRFTSGKCPVSPEEMRKNG